MITLSELGSLTFSEVAPLHDFLKHGQNYTQLPILTPGPNLQSDLLSDFSRRALNIVCEQIGFPRDDVFVVCGSIAKKGEGFVVGAEAFSGNLDCTFRKGPIFAVESFSLGYRAPGSKGRNNPSIISAGRVAQENLAETVCHELGLFPALGRMQEPRQRVVANRPGGRVGKDVVLVICENGRVKAKAIDKLQSAAGIGAWEEAC